MAERKPESAHQEFLERFRARDLDGLVALYEDGATMVAADGSTQSGKAVVREGLQGFLALGGQFTLETRYAARTGDVALLSARWRLSGTGADGKPLDMGGQTTEVVRRQPDGRWLYIIDHPWGGQ
jgi:uncharacterized protein (TIGR02246 family)